MISTLIAGFGILLCSGFINSYISCLLLDQMSTDNSKNDL